MILEMFLKCCLNWLYKSQLILSPNTARVILTFNSIEESLLNICVSSNRLGHDLSKRKYLYCKYDYTNHMTQQLQISIHFAARTICRMVSLTIFSSSLFPVKKDSDSQSGSPLVIALSTNKYVKYKFLSHRGP